MSSPASAPYALAVTAGRLFHPASVPGRGVRVDVLSHVQTFPRRPAPLLKHCGFTLYRMTLADVIGDLDPFQSDR